MGDKVRLNVYIKPYEHDPERKVALTVQELEHRRLLRQAFVASDQETIVLAKRNQPELEICHLST